MNRRIVTVPRFGVESFSRWCRRRESGDFGKSLRNPLSRGVSAAMGNRVTGQGSVAAHGCGIRPADRAQCKAHWTIIIWRGTKVRDSVSRPVLSSRKKYGRQTYEEIRPRRFPLLYSPQLFGLVFSRRRLEFFFFHVRSAHPSVEISSPKNFQFSRFCVGNLLLNSVQKFSIDTERREMWQGKRELKGCNNLCSRSP